MLRSARGFSLIELSVVLMVIGILAGIIMVGQGLMQRYELRRVITDANSYVTAIHQFHDKYGALPGDMATATKIWGTAVGMSGSQCTDPEHNVSVGKPTCNGDGNGIISNVGCEYYRAWQQMFAAGLIEGKYAGISPIAGAMPCQEDSVVGYNVPGGPLGGSAFSMRSYGQIGGAYGGADANLYDGQYDNLIIFGGVRSNEISNGPILMTDAAHEIDSKTDDGDPANGSIRATQAAAAVTPNCTNGAAAYNETYRQPACSLFFMGDYLTQGTNR